MKKPPTTGTIKGFSFANHPSRVPPRLVKAPTTATKTLGFRVYVGGRRPR